VKDRISLVSEEEAEEFMARYWAGVVEYEYRLSFDGKAVIPAFVLKNDSDIIVNKDGSITWAAREIGVGLHSFLEVKTGERKKKTIYFPLCLVSPRSRELLVPLINTTVDPKDGRLNSKEAEVYIVLKDRGGIKLNFSLPSLTTQEVMLNLFPQDLLPRYKSKHCPFCKDLDIQGENVN